MEYACVDSRFLFFNGLGRYTVEYCYGLGKWFVFKDRGQSDAVYMKEDKNIKLKNINMLSAENVLNEYLQIDF